MIRPRRLNAVTLTVRNLARSLDWYHQKFGFERLYDDAPNSDGVVIGAGGVEMVLKQVANPAQATMVDHPRQVCVQLFAFEVDPADLDRVEQEFADDADMVRLDDHPRYRSRIVEDPDGHAIELYAAREPAGGATRGVAAAPRA